MTQTNIQFRESFDQQWAEQLPAVTAVAALTTGLWHQNADQRSGSLDDAALTVYPDPSDRKWSLMIAPVDGAQDVNVGHTQIVEKQGRVRRVFTLINLPGYAPMLHAEPAEPDAVILPLAAFAEAARLAQTIRSAQVGLRQASPERRGVRRRSARKLGRLGQSAQG